MKIGHWILIAFLTLSYTLTAQEKPYSLEKDRKTEKQLKKQTQIELDKPIENVIRNLYDENKKIRLQTIETLKRVDDTTQIPVFEDLLLNDSVSEVREKCARALWYMESYSSIHVLKKSLNDSIDLVKLASALALASLGEKEKSFEILNDFWNYGKGNYIQSCHLGFRYIATEEAVNNLKYDMNNNDSTFIAVEAAIILAQLEYYDDAFPKLKELLNNNDKYIRGAALRGLAYIGDNKSLKIIEKISHADSEEIIKNRCKLILSKYDYENK